MSPRLAALSGSWADGLAAALGRLAGTRGAVLCFHGLDTDTAPSHSSMHVPLPLFEATVGLAQKLGTVVPLRDLVTRHVAGRSTTGLIAVTADDAYASLLAAEPFLARTGVPCAVFVVSDALATGGTYWWDRIDDVFPVASADRWRRFEDECGLPDTYRRGQPVEEGRARPVRQWLLAVHGGRWSDALEGPMARLEADVGARTAQRSMTDAELAGFVKRTGVQLAVHTRSHAALPFLSDDDLVGEITRCHTELRARFPDVLPYLAIPFGLFDARTLRLAAEAGMAASLTLAGQTLRRPFDVSAGLSRVCVVREHRSGVVALKLSGVAAVLNRLRGRAVTTYPLLPSPTT
jgi:peptidoglycan/xylan/chitin deacetylase (PgdA/CDA1 family)